MTRFGSFELDAGRRQLFSRGSEIHLTPKAFDLLALLIEAAPQVVPKGQLHARLWPNGVVSDSTLVGLVKEIRRALSDRDRKAPLIRTAHRVGYAFNASVERATQRSRLSRWLVAGKRRVALVEGENVIGRDSEVNVWLDHATVSRRHASVVVSDASAVLQDLDSKNGTTIGGTRLTAAVTLRNGDRFACGDVLVTYRESSVGLPTATQVSRIGEAHSSN
jgi:DNA-binding winged helix-turn-helix (wHTH) protein